MTYGYDRAPYDGMFRQQMADRPDVPVQPPQSLVFGTVPLLYGGRLVPAVAIFEHAEAAVRYYRQLYPDQAVSPAALARARAIPLYPVLVKTAKGNLYGYINDQGNVVIPPQYEYALDFQPNGLAVVQAGNKQGVINASGRYVVRPVYDSVSSFSEGLASVIDGQGFRVIDETGRLVTPKAYSFIGTYRDGRAVFSQTGADGQSRYGYLDREGKEAIPARYLEANDFAGGKAVVKVKDGEYALIDKDGKSLAVYPYAFVGSMGDGLLAFQKEANGKYGYIDEKGTVIIPPRFTSAMPFEGGFAVVNTAEDYNNHYGLINKNGSFVIPAEYNEVEQLGEGRVAVGKATDPSRPYIGSSFALADTSGRLLTDFRFTNITDYKDGYASVSDKKETYWIDHNGNRATLLPAMPGSGTMAFIGNLISANVDLRLFYFDRAGKMVWKPNTTIPLAPPYAVREEKFKPNKDYLVYYPQVEGMADKKAEESVNRKLKQLSAVKPVPPDSQLEASYTGDFAVTFFRDKLLVLKLEGYNFPFGAAHGMPSREYVHLNLATGDMYELKDLFKPGSPYVKRISDIIAHQIATDPKYSYVFPGSFKQIAPNQLFYVTENALHILFQPYEIAPYAAGFPEFTIPYAELTDIIDTNGSFWKSFH
ncbi:WG repeat-containing protein [Paenibacillus ginsengarvi]|nr:WG repeat-containing protein [Paenibacillus ginsengarvi]